MDTQEVLNQTTKKDPGSGDQFVKKDVNLSLFPVWQGLQDDYQTYCGLVGISTEGNKRDV